MGLNRPVVTANTSPIALTAVEPTKKPNTDSGNEKPKMPKPLTMSKNRTLAE